MTKLEVITQILSLPLSDEEKTRLIQNLDKETEAATESVSEPDYDPMPDEPAEFEKLRFGIFNEEWCIYKRAENPHESEDAIWMYGVLIKRPDRSIGKAVFFDETDRFGKKGWLYFDPDSNPKVESKRWAKYYARVTDCCRYLLGFNNGSCTFEEVRQGKKTFRDFAPDTIEVPKPTFDPTAEFDDALPFT